MPEALLRWRTWFVGLVVAALIAPVAIAQDEGAPPPIQWREWNEKLFREAKETKRYILLDLNARWCHWCQFMERRTYAHPEVRRVVAAGYLAVKVDQDANPDLASRYGDWGWPATIIFDPDGKEVAKLQGFQRPSRMFGILYTILAHPERVPKIAATPDVVPSSKPFLTKAQRFQIESLLEETYDAEHAGWGRRLKFLQSDVIEYALKRAQAGDVTFETRVRKTLDAALVLIDPIWGGTYQYSHARDWSAPHYEKIMAFQANGIILYARAYAQFKDERYLAAAKSIANYLLTKLRSPDGAFFTSQDADVDETILGKDFYKLNQSERAALGKEPGIDANRYARENGWAAWALAELYAATGDATYRDAARKALTWTIANRTRPNGGFMHGNNDRGGPYLSDNVAMGRAFLSFYMISGKDVWLKRAATTADFISRTFRHKEAGLITTFSPPASGAAFAEPFRNVEENIAVARFANLLNRTHGADRYRALAKHAMRFLTSRAVTSQRRFMLGTVLGDDELAIEPAHVTVVGRQDDAAATALHRAALRLPIGYKRVDFWDPTRGPMLNPDVTYPKMERAAAFACANQICSLPVFKPAELTDAVRKMMAQRKAVTPNRSK